MVPHSIPPYPAKNLHLKIILPLIPPLEKQQKYIVWRYTADFGARYGYQNIFSPFRKSGNARLLYMFITPMPFKSEPEFFKRVIPCSGFMASPTSRDLYLKENNMRFPGFLSLSCKFRNYVTYDRKRVISKVMLFCDSFSALCTSWVQYWERHKYFTAFTRRSPINSVPSIIFSLSVLKP